MNYPLGSADPVRGLKQSIVGGINPGSELTTKRTDIAITVGHKDGHGDGGPVTVAAVEDDRGIFVYGPIAFSVDEILERDVNRTIDEAGGLDLIIVAHVDHDQIRVPVDLLEYGIGGDEAPAFRDARKHLVDNGGHHRVRGCGVKRSGFRYAESHRKSGINPSLVATFF